MRGGTLVRDSKKQKLISEEYYVDKNICPQCAHENQPDFMICENCEAPLSPQAQDQSTKSLKVYKVISQSDKWFTGRFSPQSLEQALNAYADQGWKVIAVATAVFPGLVREKEEII